MRDTQQDYYKVVAMAGNSALYRRPSGIYVVRIAVPTRHRHTLGKNELHISTSLREWNAAKLASLRIQVNWLEHFMALDTGTRTTAETLLHGQGLVSVDEAARLLGVSATTLLTELLNGKCPITAYANEWPCWEVDTLATIAQESNGSYLMNEVEEVGNRRIYSGAVQPLDSAAAMGSLIATSSYIGDIFRVGTCGAVFCDAKHEMGVAAVFANKSDVDAIRARLGNLTANALFNPVQKRENSTTDPITSKHGKKRFSTLFDLYKNSREWKPDQQKRMSTESKLFVDLMSDPTLDAIDVEAILEYARRLALVPSDIYLARRRYNVTSVEELIEVAETQSLGRKSPQTIKGHIGRISEIINFGLRNGMVSFNAAADFKRGRGRNTKQRAQDERDVFEPEELQCIFSLDWYSTGRGNGKNWRPFNYWLPLIGLLSGGRLNEIAQLYLDDIKQTAAGTWFLDFNLVQPDKLDDEGTKIRTAGDKSLKTSNSVRVVPLHPTLIRLGLPLYANALRAAGEERLFPELRHDKIKGYGKPAGAWFNERLLGHRLHMARDGRKTFHSLRHCFITALERQNLPERVMTQLAGHERGRSQSTQRYAKDRDADELVAVLDALQFDFLQDVVPIDIDAAIAALAVAKNRKQVLRRALLKRKQDQ
jgi:integrase/DNA-binding transcriptional regulator/RsmH inhibitor MraZ